MRFYVKVGIFFLPVIFVFNVFSSVCLAAELKENGRQVYPVIYEGKITGVKIVVNEANGGPKINTLPLIYPASTILITKVSLTAKKGLYKIELLEKGNASLTLASRGGEKVVGSGRLGVNADGSVHYRVIAEKAKNVVFDLSFSPLSDQDGSRVRVSAEEKISAEGDGLNLVLTCIAGKNCLLQMQNMSESMAYRNVLFRIDYKMMTKEGNIEKSKSGKIEDVLFPNITGEWPIDLVFGEPPKDINISLISADEVDPAGIEVTENGQSKKVIPLLPAAPLYR